MINQNSDRLIQIEIIKKTKINIENLIIIQTKFEPNKNG
jgi:hypothetical protein